MTCLTREPNFDNADDFYAALLAVHDGLEEDASHALNARLILILANHIGDKTVLEEALHAARAAVD